MSKTDEQYKEVIDSCSDIFLKKMKDYGTAWRILRATSLTDQIFIKAQRIRGVQEKGFSKVAEGVEPEFIGIINYSIMAIIQLELGSEGDIDEDPKKIEDLYFKYFNATKALMDDKNHDYGEAWREMEVISLTDLIIQKIYRMKSILKNDGKTNVSEGIDANFQDILNYSVFAQILLKE